MKVSIPGIGVSLGECIICGKSFLAEVISGESVGMVHIGGFNMDLPIHKRGECMENLKRAANSNDWKELPDGPLRQEFEKATSEAK